MRVYHTRVSLPERLRGKGRRTMQDLKSGSQDRPFIAPCGFTLEADVPFDREVRRRVFQEATEGISVVRRGWVRGGLTSGSRIVPLPRGDSPSS